MLTQSEAAQLACGKWSLRVIGVAHTKGFASGTHLSLHFADHGKLLGAASEAEYLSRADVFLGAPRPAGVAECHRSKGDIVRFSHATQEYGVLSATGHIRSYYLPEAIWHHESSNAVYFCKECLKARK